ncbi:hypothetical protein HB662_19000 [Roseomonas frigidaquae]|uniref:DUF541 domain-containing protein n=1 Tax=Falsiroseomonas frigidaquae TaxID=487318 RepID=A0ABX1F3N5_9PROT|nr:hypothetical protein [Falsiroseomonas frigidaquae]NKE46876.1 hypothetical protein [Falsiroseomonas frigidaquae]
MPVTSLPVSLRRSRRGGNNHASVASAIRVLGLLLLLLCGVALAPAVAQEDPLVQRGVPAEATAETAVLAREQALNSGQRLAYERMAASLGLSASASTQQIESMVRSLVIESERITARTYTARITVNFNPQRVAAAGGRLPASPDAAPAATDGTQSASPSPPMASGPAVTTVEALASYRSFAEWVEITRRLETAPPVARVQVVSVAGDQARLRLGLRSQAPEAALALASVGLALAPSMPERYDPRYGAATPPGGAGPGSEGWRLSLAGFR